MRGQGEAKPLEQFNRDQSLNFGICLVGKGEGVKWKSQSQHLWHEPYETTCSDEIDGVGWDWKHLSPWERLGEGSIAPHGIGNIHAHPACLCVWHARRQVHPCRFPTRYPSIGTGSA